MFLNTNFYILGYFLEYIDYVDVRIHIVDALQTKSFPYESQTLCRLENAFVDLSAVLKNTMEISSVT